jgi:hypothetical protein
MQGRLCLQQLAAAAAAAGDIIITFHSKNAIDPAPQGVIKTTRWNKIAGDIAEIEFTT